MPNKTISIIIPTRNEEKNITRCLDSILTNGYPFFDIIVVDQESTDKTAEIATSKGARVVNVPKSEIYQPPAQSRNVGFKHAAGDYIYHIDADMELERGLLEELVEKLDISDVSAVIVPETDVPLNIWAKAKAFERSFLDETGSEAARASKREIFEKIMYADDVSSGEDWYIHEQFSKAGRILRSKKVVFHHIGKISPIKEFKKKLSYGKASTTYVQKNSKGLGNMFLKMLYVYMKKILSTFFIHPIVVMCFIILRGIDLAGVLMGYMLSSKFSNQKE